MISIIFSKQIVIKSNSQAFLKIRIIS